MEHSEGNADVLETQPTSPVTQLIRRRLPCLATTVAPMQSLHANSWLVEEGSE